MPVVSALVRYILRVKFSDHFGGGIGHRKIELLLPDT